MDILGFGKISIRTSPIRKIGLDTNISLAWFRNQKIERNHRPKIFNRNDALYISYKVFGELLYQIAKETGKSPEEARNEIFIFLRRNRINLLRKRDLQEKLFGINKILSDLRDQRKNFKEKPEDSDLEIISIFYVAGMDCIFSSNYRHFEEPCKYLKIDYERHFIIEIGSIQDVNRMLKNLYRPKRFFKKKR